MQNSSAHFNPNNIPKQSKTFPTHKKQEGSLDEPIPFDLKSKLKTMSQVNYPNTENYDFANHLIPNHQNHNQIIQNDNNHVFNEFQEQDTRNNYPLNINNSNSNRTENYQEYNNKEIVNNSKNNQILNPNNNDKFYNTIENNHSDKYKSDIRFFHTEAADQSDSLTNSNKNFKANTTEYALINSGNISNQNFNSYSLRQNKVSGHTYTKLAERMKSADKKLNNIIPNYNKNKVESNQGKFTSEIFNNLNNQLTQNNNYNITDNRENHKDKDNNYNPNEDIIQDNLIDKNSISKNNNHKVNLQHKSSAAYATNDQFIDSDRNQKESNNEDNENLNPEINNSINNYNNNQLGKLDSQIISNHQIQIDPQSYNNKDKNSTMTDIRLISNKAPNESLTDNYLISNNQGDKNLINNYNPNLKTNKISNLKKFDEENFVEPSMQKLDYSISDDQNVNQKQSNFASNPNTLQNPNIIFYEKNNTNISNRQNKNNSHYDSINNTNSNFNITNNNYYTTNNNFKTYQSSKH